LDPNPSTTSLIEKERLQMSMLSAFPPITKADLARARMFGLRLPAAPLADEASAAVADPAPAPVDQEDDGPAWTWPAWTDTDVWTITEPEPAPLQSDDESMAGPADAWVRITPFVAVRATTTPDRTDSRPDSPRGLIELEGPRPTVEDWYIPTKWESDQASRLFAPPARKPRYTGTGMTDSDVAPRGVC
jgi:hypothetical protein